MATLVQVYYKLDNGSNVCGLEFNFTRRNDFVEGAQNSVRSDLGDDVSYDKQIFQQFSHGFDLKWNQRKAGQCLQFGISLFVSYLPPLRFNDNDTILL